MLPAAPLPAGMPVVTSSTVPLPGGAMVATAVMGLEGTLSLLAARVLLWVMALAPVAPPDSARSRLMTVRADAGLMITAAGRRMAVSARPRRRTARSARFSRGTARPGAARAAGTGRHVGHALLAAARGRCRGDDHERRDGLCLAT